VAKVQAARLQAYAIVDEQKNARYKSKDHRGVVTKWEQGLPPKGKGGGKGGTALVYYGELCHRACCPFDWRGSLVKFRDVGKMGAWTPSVGQRVTFSFFSNWDHSPPVATCVRPF
jgi:hypothetical protein